MLGFSFSGKLFETCSVEIMDTEVTQIAIFLTSITYILLRNKKVNELILCRIKIF